MIKIYDSMRKEKIAFTPRLPGRVDLYVCGVTVYDHSHLGHARVLVVFDLLCRLLERTGHEVRYVRNITDIDDKIIQRALAEGTSASIIAERYAQSLLEDERALNLQSPTMMPKATEFIGPMIELIGQLLQKGHAYVGAEGDVYFAVRSYPDYGALSHQTLDTLQAGARVEVDSQKKDPLDFVLWKLSKKGEPAWESPWGLGRPGWHTECAAMSLQELGAGFDLHGGGPDLKFPHHENERAQAECCTRSPFVRHWMHVGPLEAHSEKMSKSLNNFVTIKEALRRHTSPVLRYFLLSAHYRSPLDYHENRLDSARESLLTLQGALDGFYPPAVPPTPKSSEIETALTDLRHRFEAALLDDLNTPLAFSILFDWSHQINRAKKKDWTSAEWLAGGLFDALLSLGFDLKNLMELPQHGLEQLNTVTGLEIQRLIEERHRARQQGDFAAADKIRDFLSGKGIELEDHLKGTAWKLKKGVP